MYTLQEKDIGQYLNEMLPELNIRLWIDMYGGGFEERILWLENIELTSYTPYSARQKSISQNICTDAPQHNKWRIINRLMGIKAFKLPFTLKKYKKERR